MLVALEFHSQSEKLEEYWPLRACLGSNVGACFEIAFAQQISSEDVGLIVGDFGDGGDFPALLMAFQRFIGSGLGSPRVWGRVDTGNHSKRDDRH